jgi:Ni,Fe-hydrogenase I cytochrome b subunit
VAGTLAPIPHCEWSTVSSTRLAFVAVAWLFVACVMVQVFLAGLGVFADGENFNLHREFGYLFGWLTLILLVLALAGRLGRRWIGLSALLLVLFALQSVFVALREVIPAAAALHPVNALAIFYVALVVARGSRATLLDSPAAPVTPAEPEAIRP